MQEVMKRLDAKIGKQRYISGRYLKQRQINKN